MFPIRIRLTLIFGGLLFIALVLSGIAVVTLLRQRLTARLEESLDHRLRGVENFLIRETTAATAHTIPLELEEYASTQPEGHLIEVRDESEKMLLRSEPMPSPVLVRERAFTLHGHSFHAKAAGSMAPIDESVHEVAILFAWSSPALLLLIGLTGYWISRGSLYPVDEMTRAARSIGANNLSDRLSVPQPRDEIRRLAEAWNEMLARLEESFSRIQRFTEDAAHELRTPLTVLRTSAELALRRDREPEEYRETLANVVKSTDRLAVLTEGLLSVARGEHPPAPQNVTRVNLTSLIRGLTTEMEPLFLDKGVALTLDLPEQSIHLYGEADSLRRLLASILDNALKYTPTEGAVNVKLRETMERLTVEISDTGCGIPPESLPRIFDRFYRVDPSRDRTTGGYGLGLAIAQQIARSHHGQIDVLSVIGEGSEFQISFLRDGLAPG